jgi:SAM-dependent methyltransferase
MDHQAEFEQINEVKTSMDDIYDRADPRAYFRELKKLDYAIPGAAKPLIQTLIGQLRHDDGEATQLLDVGCSYGVNAALIKYDLSLSELYAHWGQTVLQGAASDDVIENDRSYFDQLDASENVEVIGLDVAENAVAFGTEVGLLDQGMVVNLETDPLPEPCAQKLTSVDLVMSTGCVGYVTERTFEKLLPAVSRGGQPWLANLVLRMFPFDQIAARLGDRGYVTEKLNGRFFAQRRFACSEEQQQVLEQLKDRGIETFGLEDEGQYFAEFYLSRPAEQATETPIDELFGS